MDKKKKKITDIKKFVKKQFYLIDIFLMAQPECEMAKTFYF